MDIVEKLRRQAASDEAAGTLYSHTVDAEAADEIERLRKDAARYRWLRGGDDVPAASWRWSKWEVRWWSGRYWNTIFGDQMDAAVDVAMAQEKTPNAGAKAPPHESAD